MSAYMKLTLPTFCQVPLSLPHPTSTPTQPPPPPLPSTLTKQPTISAPIHEQSTKTGDPPLRVSHVSLASQS